ncbi:MAG: hypothetical protein JST00_22775 [Deltaproteobacteria bacterium]|nr:hypothetical protein [Deltaproteobacteria bacterium]
MGPHASRLFVLVAASAIALGSAVLVGCPTPEFPKGPPPEYEEPLAPSWVDGGADRAAPPTAPPPAQSASDGGVS